MAGGEKLIGKALLLDGFLSCLGLRNLQTQVVHLEKKIDLHSPSFMACYVRHTDRPTDRLTDRPIKAHGTSRRLRPLSVITLLSYAVVRSVMQLLQSIWH